MEPRTIFFIGKPGSGKGVQARMLAEKTGWPLIIASDQIRAIAGEKSAVGRKPREVIDGGVLTLSWFPNYVFLKTIFSLPAGGSVIFDGFNRIVHEAEFNSEALEWIGRSYPVIYLIVSENEVRRRLKLRKEEESRADDDAIDTRMEQYYKHTEASIEFFRKKEVLIEINGEQTPEKIAADIRTAL